MFNYCFIRLCVLSAATSFVLPAHGRTIEEVIVSSTRTEQTLNELPLSVGVLDSQTLAVQNVDHPAEALSLVPGVNLHRGSGSEHLTAIRSPVLTGGAGAGSFLYLQDGIPLRSAGFGNTNGLLGAQTELAEQIEVIRGPSGPVYGANAVHGVINVLTPNPAEDNSGNLRLSTDSHERHKLTGMLNWRQGEQSWLTGISLKKENGYREEAGLDEQKVFVRQNIKNSAVKIDTILNAYNINQETAGFIFGKESLLDRDLRRENEFPFAYRDAKSVQLQSRISKSMKENNSFQITPFVRWHEMEFLQHFLPSQAIETNGHWSIGAQSDISLSYEKLEILTGIDVEYTEGYLEEVQTLPTIFSFTQGVHYDYEVDASSLAGFVQADYALTEQLKATAGVRIDYTRYDYDNRTDDGVVGRFLRVSDREDSFTTTSPKIGLEYQSSENMMSYVSLARANRPPQTSDLYRLQRNQTEDTADAEQMDALEIGFRYHVNDIFSTHIAAYMMEKENYFFRDADGFNVNDGKTRHRGIEVDLDVNLTKNLSLISAISFARHTYDFDRVVARDTEVISKGNEVDTAPRKFANTRLAWSATSKLYLEAQWVMMGEYYTDAANLHSYEGHDIFNFRAEYKISNNTKLSLAVRNATDKLYAERADYAFGRERFFPAETRTVGISLNTSF